MANKQNIAVALLQCNEGQIEGLPRNPRFIKDERFKKLVKSLQDDPEMLDLRELIVYPHGKHFVVIGGNMRLRAGKELGFELMPCKILPADTPIEKLKAYVIKDNNAFGNDDFDLLANEWDTEFLEDCGFDFGSFYDSEAGGATGGGMVTEDVDTVPESWEKKDKIEEVEVLLNKAMQENLRECVSRMSKHINEYVFPDLTVGLAKAKFIRALHYGDTYPQWLSYVFHPHQLQTSADTRSIWEQAQISAEKGEAGIAGFRTTTKDGRLNAIFGKGGYPICGARAPMDFPSALCKSLIEEFAPKGCSVLDPCHGWGGRLVGALLAGVKKYTGVDPREPTSRGVEKIKEAFMPYTQTQEVTIVRKCFEETDFKHASFDFAITSPPYFDVEQYLGEEQSHKRYSNFELWCEKFYRPLIEKTYAYLKKGGVFCLQVGSQSYPLHNKALDYANACGFTVVETRPFGGATTSPLHGNEADNDNEVIIILRK